MTKDPEGTLEEIMATRERGRSVRVVASREENEMTRNEARWKIIQECNKFMHASAQKRQIRGVTPIPTTFNMKNIQQAVFMARQRKLVEPEIYQLAGFR